jgi:hypothetical protein
MNDSEPKKNDSEPKKESDFEPKTSVFELTPKILEALEKHALPEIEKHHLEQHAKNIAIFYLFERAGRLGSLRRGGEVPLQNLRRAQRHIRFAFEAIIKFGPDEKLALQTTEPWMSNTLTALSKINSHIIRAIIDLEKEKKEAEEQNKGAKVPTRTGRPPDLAGKITPYLGWVYERITGKRPARGWDFINDEPRGIPLFLKDSFDALGNSSNADHQGRLLVRANRSSEGSLKGFQVQFDELDSSSTVRFASD